MATLTTRILETRKERLIVILLLALGVPVLGAADGHPRDARRALAAGRCAIWAGVVLGVHLRWSGGSPRACCPGASSDFVLELPPLRVPRPGNIARQDARAHRVVPAGGGAALRARHADPLRRRPAAPARLARAARREPRRHGRARPAAPRRRAAFVVGFLRRDFGAAGLYRHGPARPARPGPDRSWRWSRSRSSSRASPTSS